MKINRPLQSLSSMKRVKSVGHRQNNNQQNLFKETFKERQNKKKEKEDPMHVKISDNSATGGREKQVQIAVRNNQTKKFSHKRIIDIRV